MDKRVENTIHNLKKHGFTVLYAENVETAKRYMADYVKRDTRIGVGGSATVQELGIRDLVAGEGAQLLDHNLPGLSPEENTQTRYEELSCDVFFTGTNAISETGSLVNIDGFGNRVASMIFGPRQVVVLATVNKIEEDLEKAIDRAQLVAAPRNNQRLQTENPCTVTGKCIDCNSPTRICRSYSVIKRPSGLTPTTVILIEGEMGF